MSIFRRTPKEAVDAALRDTAKEYAGIAPQFVLPSIRRQHRTLLARIEAVRGPAAKEWAVELLRILGPLALAMLEAWLLSLIDEPPHGTEKAA